ncbi:MAG: glycosyltransferase [Planctomycetia bacterium]|nr:glycosyltransferase [Planctomycetia bacterium]
MSDQLLSILVPVYNEQAYLARIIDRVIQAPVPCELRKEIILVNDASTDKTAEVIEQITKKYPDLVRAFHQPYNQGKGAAIQRAIKEMKGDFAIIQDADLEYDPDEYPIVLKPLVEGLADVVYGSRFLTREMRKVLFYHHKLGNLFLTHLSNWTTGLDLTDMETCYKAFRGEILKSIPIRSRRFGIEPEITAKIAKRGLTVYEVPISYHGRRYSEGKKIGWKDGVSAIKTILTYWLIDDCYVDSADNPNLLRTMEQARNFTRLIIKKSASRFGQKIVELGSGLGNVSKHLPQKETLLLTDSMENNIRILKNSYDGNAVVEVDHLDPQREIPGSNRREQFDTAILFNQLEHAADDEKVLECAADLLEPNGRVLIVVPKESHCCWKLKKYGGYEQRYSKRDLKKKLEEAGFEMETIQSFNRIGSLLWRWNQICRRPSAHPFGRFGLKIFDTFLGWGEWLFFFLPGANWFVVGKKK